MPTDASAAAEVVPPPVVDPLVPPPEVVDLDPVTLAPPRPEMPAVPFAPDPSASRSCPDCGAALAPIRLLDQTGRGSALANLEYAGVGSQPGFWSGRFPVAGVVRAWMCRECGRILLFGEPAPEV